MFKKTLVSLFFATLFFYPQNGSPMNIFEAIEKNDPEQVKHLVLIEQVDVNQTDSNGETPLHEACSEENFNIVKLLLEKDADPNMPNNKGETPICWACCCGNFDIVKLLLEKDADPNRADRQGKTPLYWACHTALRKILRCPKGLEIVLLLLENGAIVSEEDINGTRDETIKKYLEKVMVFDKTTNKLNFIIQQKSEWPEIFPILVKRATYTSMQDTYENNTPIQKTLCYEFCTKSKAASDIIAKMTQEHKGNKKYTQFIEKIIMRKNFHNNINKNTKYKNIKIVCM